LRKESSKGPRKTNFAERQEKKANKRQVTQRKKGGLFGGPRGPEAPSPERGKKYPKQEGEERGIRSRGSKRPGLANCFVGKRSFLFKRDPSGSGKTGSNPFEVKAAIWDNLC